MLGLARNCPLRDMMDTFAVDVAGAEFGVNTVKPIALPPIEPARTRH